MYRTAISILLLIWTSFLAAGCDKPKTVDQPVKLPEKFSQAGKIKMPDKWWLSFNDPNLNKLMDQALSDNFSLKTAWDRLTQARAAAVIEGADLYPQVQAEGNAGRVLTQTRAGKVYTSDYGVGIVASYEIDVWGRVRSTAQAAQLDVQATENDLKAAAITISAQVATTWYALIESRGQLKIIDEQIKTNKQYLDMIVLRFRRGQVTATDVLQQQQLLESTKGERKLAIANIKVLEHQLAILIGQAPGKVKFPAADTLPKLPALPKTPVPSALLQRRPDVNSAYLSIKAADKRVAAAIANLLPQFSLTLSATTGGETTNAMFRDWIGTLLGNMVAPIFEGGARLAEVDRRKALASEAVNTYADTVLAALAEVEDALIQEIQQEKYLESLSKQLELSDKSVKQTREMYIKGAEDFLRFLTTVTNNQTLQQTNLNSKLNLINYRISLYRSLCGGWEMTPPEEKQKIKIKN